MTSNLGSHIIQDHFDNIEDANVDEVVDATKEELMLLLRQTLRPEFINRIDEVVMFRPLSKNNLKGIIKIQLQDLKNRVAEQGIQMSFTDYALDYFVQHGYDPQFGARPLKRLIQKQIINLLSKKIIAGEIDKDKEVIIDVFDGVVVVRNQKG